MTVPCAPGKLDLRAPAPALGVLDMPIAGAVDHERLVLGRVASTPRTATRSRAASSAAIGHQAQRDAGISRAPVPARGTALHAARAAPPRWKISSRRSRIAPELLPHVFDRFRQGDSSKTRKHGGLGLGLAIVRHLVEAHAGVASAESAGQARGASFLVKLPLVSRGREAARPQPSSSGNSPAAQLPTGSGQERLTTLTRSDAGN